ncbi:MAG: SMP-30/gluconolactonase/LRE family protein [Verrucomicrobiota bacterium]|nr:SMP-30/gluconolactonase/LRE family protein [Verrucomicrobiota bacterium]
MSKTPIDRRQFLTTAAVAGAGLATAAARDWSGQNPTRYPDPDLISLDPRFNKYKIGNTPVQRLYTSPNALWTEGCAWNGVGRYVVFSDIPNNIQLRWIEDDNRVTVFRKPSGNSNGNTFDYRGRQISCQHGHRRVVRYEYDGTETVLADTFDGKPFNAPNDAVVHRGDDSIWFTDPGYGSLSNYEGNKGPLELKEAVYRIDAKSGQITKVADEIHKPNGLCFSPGLDKLYVVDSGSGKNIKVWEVDGAKLKNGKEFASMKAMKAQGGTRLATAKELAQKNSPREIAAGGADGIRADIDGNIWSSAGWAGDGYDGVHTFAPNGDRIGQIRLPEICSNVCFGGRKRNRLFMTASQSLYAVYTNATGAHIT